MISIVCWKWTPEKGAKHYGKRLGFKAKHVNVLRAMIERNLKIPHEFVCVTDDWMGLHSAVKVVNINRHFHLFKELGGCYRRLRAFEMEPALACFGPRFVSLDLDAVVTGPLDPIFRFREDFRIWSDTFRRKTPYCGALWGMRSGAREKVWEKFSSDPVGAVAGAIGKRYIGTDQAIISLFLPKESTWGTQDGVFNFNTQVRLEGLHPTSRIVFFNGKYDPSQPETQIRHPWIGDLWRD